jgi:hypothetical protein
MFDVDIYPNCGAVDVVQNGFPVVFTSREYHCVITEEFEVVGARYGPCAKTSNEYVTFVAKTFVVVTAFAAYKLLVTTRVERFETCQTFRVPTFAVVTNTFVVVTAFDA